MKIIGKGSYNEKAIAAMTEEEFLNAHPNLKNGKSVYKQLVPKKEKPKKDANVG